MESLAPKSRSANPGLPISKKRKSTISVTATNKTTRSKSNKKKKASPEKCVLDNNSEMDGSGTIAIPVVDPSTSRRNTALDSQKLKSLVRSAIADELPNALKISQIAFAASAKKYSIMSNEEKTWPSYIL